jgi:hypothetical protein
MALINTTTTGILGSTFVGDGTGPLTVQQNGVTLGTYGNIPVFSAYLSTSQTISASTFTKVQCNAKEFDSNNNFDTTNNRFQPTVAGYYHVGGEIALTSSVSISRLITLIYKNGSVWKTGNDISSATPNKMTVNCLVYLNGSTDYVELYGFITGTGTLTFANDGGQAFTSFMSGCLVRGA